MELKAVITALAYSILISGAFLGNLVVLFVIKKFQHMHTTTNFLLANLAVAGLWIAFWSVPFAILNSLTHVHEEGGQFLCKLVSMNNMSEISIVVSVGTMTLLAVERYFALLKPMNTQLRIEKSAVWKYVTGLWLFATLLNMPTILYAEFDEERQKCVYIWNQTPYAVTIVFFAAFSANIITFRYGKILIELYISKTICNEGVEEDQESKQKVVKLLLIQVIGFFLFYVPFVVVEFVIPQKRPILHYICTYLLYCSSAINPIIYALRCSNYRKAYKEVALEFKERMKCCSCKVRPVQQSFSSSGKESTRAPNYYTADQVI